MSDRFIDNKVAAAYAIARPDVPQEVLDCILDYLNQGLPSKDRHWKNAVDICCGSGQSTFLLQKYFDQISGFDSSQQQIECASALVKKLGVDNIKFGVSLAHENPVEKESIQLVTTSSALHWIYGAEFFNHVHDIVAENGVFAAYAYTQPSIQVNGKLNQELTDAYLGALETVFKLYFPAFSLTICREKYRNIKLPFDDVVYREFTIVKKSVGKNVVALLESNSNFAQCTKQKPELAESLKRNLQETLEKVLGKNWEDTAMEFRLYYYLAMTRKTKYSVSQIFDHIFKDRSQL